MVLPSPVFISAIDPLFKINPPIICTSKRRIFKTLFVASLATANASYLISSIVSPFFNLFLKYSVLDFKFSSLNCETSSSKLFIIFNSFKAVLYSLDLIISIKIIILKLLFNFY